MSLTLEAPATSKSTTHSDSRLAKDVVTALRNTGYPEIYKLNVYVNDREIQLRGRVSSYYFRQKAERAVLEISGGVKVNSDIVIASR